MKTGLIPVAIATSIPVLTAGLMTIINDYDEFNVVSYLTGEGSLSMLLKQKLPDNMILITDSDMITKNAYKLLKEIKKDMPWVRVAAIAMCNDAHHGLAYLQREQVSILPISVNAKELLEALNEIANTGMHCQLKSSKHEIKLTNKEKELMGLVCSNLTYKEIASLMGVSQRTVETHRDHLFDKFSINSRSALIMQSVKFGFSK